MSVVKVKKNGMWTEVAGVISDADTIDGKHANEFALAEDVDTLQGEIGIISSNVANIKTLVGETAVSEQITNAIQNIDIPDPLPEVNTDDNGAFLRVVDGVWYKVTIANAEGVVF